MTEINDLVNKINYISQQLSDKIHPLEKDLLLQYTRQLYEAVLNIEVHRQQEVKQDKIEQNDIILNDNTTSEIYIQNTTPLETSIIDSNTSLNESEAKPINSISNNINVEINSSEDFPKKLAPLKADSDIVEINNNTELEDEQQINQAENGTNNVDEIIETTSIYNSQTEKEVDDTLIIEEIVPEKSNLNLDYQNDTIEFKLWHKDIRTYIGINDKYNFISELFKGNNEAYEEILNEINTMECEADVISFLENSGVTTLYQWKNDGFSENVFFNIVRQYFTN